MQFVDTIAAPSGMRLTNDGYMVGRVKCARTGIQMYRRSELGLDGDGLVPVYRPEGAVFSEDSLATYAGKPVTKLHPSEPVTADNWSDLAVGTVGTKVIRNGDFVEVDIALMDADAIQAVRDGTREISMGYTTPVEMRDGVTPDGQAYEAVQVGPIRINHLAIVPKARGGDMLKVPVGDAHWGASPVRDHKETKPMKSIIVDGITIETTDQGVQAILKLQGIVHTKDAELAAKDSELAEKDRELAKKDAEIAAKDKGLAAAKDAIPAGAVLDAMVAERQALADAAKAIDPTVKLDGKSNAEVKREIVSNSMGDAFAKAIEGKSAAYIDAYIDVNFDRLANDVAAMRDTATAIAHARPGARHGDAASAEMSAYDATVARFNRKKA